MTLSARKSPALHFHFGRFQYLPHEPARPLVRQTLSKTNLGPLGDWPLIERRTARSPAEAATDFQLPEASAIGWVLLTSINPSLLKGDVRERVITLLAEE